PGAPAAGEHLDLVGDPRARRVDQPHYRNTRAVRRLDRADDLLDRTGAPRDRLHGGVVRHQAHRRAVARCGNGYNTVGRWGARDGSARPTTGSSAPAAPIIAARSTPVLTPMSSTMWTSSSVATCPVAPGAYGQPPRPPTLASKSATPSWSAASTLANPVPRV